MGGRLFETYIFFATSVSCLLLTLGRRLVPLNARGEAFALLRGMLRCGNNELMTAAIYTCTSLLVLSTLCANYCLAKLGRSLTLSRMTALQSGLRFATEKKSESAAFAPSPLPLPLKRFFLLPWLLSVTAGSCCRTVNTRRNSSFVSLLILTSALVNRSSSFVLKKSNTFLLLFFLVIGCTGDAFRMLEDVRLAAVARLRVTEPERRLDQSALDREELRPWRMMYKKVKDASNDSSLGSFKRQATGPYLVLWNVRL